MEIVYVGDRSANNRALLISNEEWKRLGKILTKKMDKEDAVEANKRLKEIRRETSKKMVNGWDNTELNKTKKLLEQKQEALSELEAKRRQRDEEMKREAIEVRNMIIEKTRKQKFLERDAVKKFNRALQHAEVFKERAIQLKFNKNGRDKMMENDLMTAQEQNKELEQYQKEQMENKQKNNQLKRAKAEILLKELKDRENERRENEIALIESGKEELQKISKEIDEMNEKASADARLVKEKLQKDIADNRESIARNEKMRQTEEEEEEMVTVIMAETKKMLAKARRLKELELMQANQSILEEMRNKVAVWPIKINEWAESDIKNAIETEEQRYKDGQCEKRELAKRKMEYVESGKTLWAEEMARRQEQLTWDHKRDTERRKREKRLLTEFFELCKKKQTENAYEFQKRLDKQCIDKKAELLADRQADIDRHEAFEHQWHKEDEEFIAYTENEINKMKLNGNQIVPLLKNVKDYLKKNNLCLDKDNKVTKQIPKGPTYTSRIIRYID